MWFPSVCLLCLLVTLPNQTHALMKHQRMINHLAGVVVAATSFCHPIPALADSTSSAELVQQGMQRFRTADVSGSVQAFDDAIALRPGLSRLLWQRGLSLYYAERFSDCAKQFRDDIALNPQDAEEVTYLINTHTPSVTRMDTSYQLNLHNTLYHPLERVRLSGRHCARAGSGRVASKRPRTTCRPCQCPNDDPS